MQWSKPQFPHHRTHAAYPLFPVIVCLQCHGLFEEVTKIAGMYSQAGSSFEFNGHINHYAKASRQAQGQAGRGGGSGSGSGNGNGAAGAPAPAAGGTGGGKGVNNKKKRKKGR
jgi:uncharacterized membrane protein YgcG